LKWRGKKKPLQCKEDDQGGANATKPRGEEIHAGLGGKRMTCCPREKGHTYFSAQAQKERGEEGFE